MPPQHEAEQETFGKLKKCEELVGYQFVDQVLLKNALTHASSSDSRLLSNERLEFLGDSILGFIVCERLFLDYPKYLEGDLTKVKSVVVSRDVCGRIGEKIGLGQCLIVGRGMQMGGAIPKSLLSDAMESLVAAIYLDGGIEEALKFVATHFFPEIESIVQGHGEGNHKSLLQQYSQRAFGIPPTYHIVAETGPDHDKRFQVVAEVGKVRYDPAWGNNKKEAEQGAAENALIAIDEHDFQKSNQEVSNKSKKS